MNNNGLNNHDSKSDDTKNYDLYTENIVKKNEIGKKALKALTFMAGAVAFGVIATFIIVWFYPLASSYFVKDNPRQQVTIEKDNYPERATDGMSEIYDNEQSLESQDNLQSNESEKNAIYYSENIKKTVQVINKSMVTITMNNVTSDDFANSLEKKSYVSGVIVAVNNIEYLVMTRYSTIKDAADMTATFADSSQAGIHILKADAKSDIAILAVNIDDISANTQNGITPIEMNNSYFMTPGDGLLFAGKLDGVSNSYSNGIVSSISVENGMIDMCCNCIHTDMIMKSGDDGFVFGIDGKLIGMVNAVNKESASVCAYGISDFKSIIEQLSNVNAITYFGVTGINVTDSIKDKYNIPSGVYVTSVENNSPAYNAGIQPGDVITSVQGSQINTFRNLTDKINQFAPGDKTAFIIKRFARDEYKDMSFEVTFAAR